VAYIIEFSVMSYLYEGEYFSREHNMAESMGRLLQFACFVYDSTLKNTPLDLAPGTRAQIRHAIVEAENVVLRCSTPEKSKQHPHHRMTDGRKTHTC
jgi:hypothetical protein